MSSVRTAYLVRHDGELQIRESESFAKDYPTLDFTFQSLPRVKKLVIHTEEEGHEDRVVEVERVEVMSYGKAK